MTIEQHPLEPFLPEQGRILFLGSFPPPQVRWSMNFFYPNWINDFWRIQGLLHFGNKHHFEVEGEKRFDKERIVAFCKEKGIALFDTAQKVHRLKDNADDNFLEIIERTEVFSLLAQMPLCNIVVTTGGKASEELCQYLGTQGIEVKIPKVGKMVSFSANISASSRVITWWRMPSSSRAYPMKIEKKAEYYKLLWK
ncbi:MAG: uracil-DNA glycosylase family protein [Bacteroidales bacterium]|nr:uracil-DNA glycosylase family protein [Bacteroidales bacterium]